MWARSFLFFVSNRRRLILFLYARLHNGKQSDLEVITFEQNNLRQDHWTARWTVKGTENFRYITHAVLEEEKNLLAVCEMRRKYFFLLPWANDAKRKQLLFECSVDVMITKIRSIEKHWFRERTFSLKSDSEHLWVAFTFLSTQAPYRWKPHNRWTSGKGLEWERDVRRFVLIQWFQVHA